MKNFMSFCVFFILMFSLSYVVAENYLVVGNSGPVEDVIKMAQVQSQLEKNPGNPSFTTVMDSQVTMESLRDSITVVLSGERALIVLDENAPAADFILAAEIATILESLDVSVIIIKNTEIDSDDLLTEIDRFDFEEIIDESECDDCDGFEMAEVKCAGGFSQDVNRDCMSLIEWQDYASQFCEGRGGPKSISPSSPCEINYEIAGDGNGTCVDSDGGGIYYDKGRIKLTRSDGEVFLYEDVCIDEEKLNEYSCNFATINNEDCLEGCSLDVQYKCAGGCKDGYCVQVRLTPEDSGKPMVIPKDKLIEDDGEEKEVKSSFVCGGCILEEKCYPFGYRKSGEYCSDENNEFILQLEAESICENSFECDTNLCIDSECISSGLLKKIMNWFKRLFS